MSEEGQTESAHFCLVDFPVVFQTEEYLKYRSGGVYRDEHGAPPGQSVSDPFAEFIGVVLHLLRVVAVHDHHRRALQRGEVQALDVLDGVGTEAGHVVDVLHVVGDPPGSPTDVVAGAVGGEDQAFLLDVHLLGVLQGDDLLPGSVDVVQGELFVRGREVVVVENHLRHLLHWEGDVDLRLEVWVLAQVGKGTYVLKCGVGN